MSAVKLLHANKDVSKQLDPLTQFALVLSALIHGKWGCESRISCR